MFLNSELETAVELRSNCFWIVIWNYWIVIWKIKMSVHATEMRSSRFYVLKSGNTSPRIDKFYF